MHTIWSEKADLFLIHNLVLVSYLNLGSYTQFFPNSKISGHGGGDGVCMHKILCNALLPSTKTNAPYHSDVIGVKDKLQAVSAWISSLCFFFLARGCARLVFLSPNALFWSTK